MQFLRQSTAINLPLGPFVDATDGFTAEDSLTISQADVRLKKGDAAWAQVDDDTAATHEENGWYEKEFNATDTNTVGHLKIAVHEAGARPVYHDYTVLEESVYDGMFVSGATSDIYGTGTVDGDNISNVFIDAERTESSAAGIVGLACEFTSGANAGLMRTVVSFTPASDTVRVYPGFPFNISLGDTYILRRKSGGEIVLWNGEEVRSLLNGTVPVMMACLDSNGAQVTGTADSGTTTSLTDTGRTEAAEDYWRGARILFTSGFLAGQCPRCTAFDPDADTLTFWPPVTTAVTTHNYIMLPATGSEADVRQWIGSDIDEQLIDEAGIRTAVGLSTDNLDERTLSPTAATNIALMYENVITVDDATFSPTTTAFETSRTVDVSELYDEQGIYWLTGTNAGMTTRVTGYAFTNSKVKLTTDALRDAPADGDTFLIVGRFEQ
jgi:hypothetical protein